MGARFDAALFFLRRLGHGFVGTLQDGICQRQPPGAVIRINEHATSPHCSLAGCVACGAFSE